MAREDPETKEYGLKGSVLSKHLDEVVADPGKSLSRGIEIHC